MNSHAISVSDFEGFNPVVRIASSSHPRKTLEVIVDPIGQKVTYYVRLSGERNQLIEAQNFKIDEFDAAISYYNSLD